MSFPEAVRKLLQELSSIPYENLSKRVAFSRKGELESPSSFATNWLEDHRRHRLGGTCFALTHWLKTQLDALNLDSSYLMADKRQEQNIHCGLLLKHSGQSFLLDPGYLIFEPLPLPQSGLSVVLFCSPNKIRVEDILESDVWRLHSGPRHALKHRFDFRKEPVDLSTFQQHWLASYHWPMMHYPVLNRVVDGTQYYLQKNNFLIRSATHSEMRKLSAREFLETAQNTFGLDAGLVEAAIKLF